RALEVVARRAAHLDVLTDRAGELLTDVLERARAAREGLLEDVLARRRLERELHDLADELLELVVARDEVGLAVDLDDDAGLAVCRDRSAHLALRRCRASAFRALGETLLEDHLDRLLHVAEGLDERALAVAHPGLGSLTKLLHHRRRDIRHVLPRGLI